MRKTGIQGTMGNIHKGKVQPVRRKADKKGTDKTDEKMEKKIMTKEELQAELAEMQEQREAISKGNKEKKDLEELKEKIASERKELSQMGQKKNWFQKLLQRLRNTFVIEKGEWQRFKHRLEKWAEYEPPTGGKKRI